MADDALADLLQDAILVAGYGQRAGCLRDNSLFSAIQKVSSSQEKDWNSPDVVELQSALNQAIQDIYPVTLIDLNSGWNPFKNKEDGVGIRRHFNMRLAFVVGAVSMLFLCGYYTIWSNRAASLLIELADAKESQKSTIVNELFLRFADVGENTRRVNEGSPSELLNVAIWGKISEVRSIEALITNRKGKLNEIWTSRFPGMKAYYSIRGWFQSTAQTQQSYQCNIESDEYKGGFGVDHQTFANDADDLWGYVRDYDRVLSNIRCAIGLQGAGVDLTSIYVNNFNEVISLWVLPGLYGALGAIMFYMRAFLSPMYPDPSASRIFLRVSLGIFAGISVAWFWAPPTGQNQGIVDIGLGVLTLAFLVGFSIDVFFALLDRLVTLATGAINKMGPTA